MAWVWSHSAVDSSGQRLVLLFMADCAHDDGTNAFPSVMTIARACRMTERNARYCLRELEKAGHLKRTGVHPSGTYIYSVVMGAIFAGGQPIAPEVVEKAIHTSSSTTTSGAAPCPPQQLAAPLDDLTDEEQEVMGILNDVADYHRAGKPRVSTVLKIMREFQQVDARDAARAMEAWADSPSRPMKNVSGTYRTFMRKRSLEGGDNTNAKARWRAAAESIARGES